MRTRAWLVTGLLLLMNTVVVAQSPLSDPSPRSAPDDLASSIPSVIGEYRLHIESGPLDVDVYEQSWRDLLLPLGKDVSDVWTADGYAYVEGEGTNLAFQISALRVDGVPAADLVEPLVDGIIEIMPDDYRIFAQVEWRTFGGCDVYAIEWASELLEQLDAANSESGIYHLSSGDILFQVIVTPYHAAASPSLADILERLP